MHSQSPDDEFHRLFVTQYPLLLRKLTFIMGSREVAEEAVQEAFVRALERWDTLRDRESLDRWLITVALRYAQRHQKHAAVGAVTTYDDELTQEIAAITHDPVAEAVEHRALVEELAYALALLPPEKREILTLYYYDGWTLQEVARVLRIRPSTAKVRLHRARQLLRTVYDKFFGSAKITTS